MPTQFLYGDSAPVIAPITTAQAVEQGDLVSLDSTNREVYRAEDETWDTDEATTRVNFVANFCGVSSQRKEATKTTAYGNSKANVVRVATEGTFRFDCNSASLKVGDMVGPEKDTGNNLLTQKVKKVTALNEAIGFVAEATTSSTTVNVKIRSVLLPA